MPSPAKAVYAALEAAMAREACSYQQPCLYDIAKDPEERHDLASSMPGTVRELRARALALARHSGGGGATGFRIERWGLVPNPNRSKGRYCGAAAAHRGFMVPWR